MEPNLHDLTREFTDGRITRRTFIRRALFLTGSLAATAALLQACGSSNESAPTTASGSTSGATTSSNGAATSAPAQSSSQSASQPTAAPKTGGTFTHGSAQEPDRFWGPVTGLTVSSEIAAMVDATLVEIDENLAYVPDLALDVPTIENGGVSPDGLSYTFKLRQGVKWHDGQPFTAKDVKFTYDVIMMEGVDVRGRVGWDQIASVETPDDYTVIYKFKSVYAPFLDRVASAGMLPQHILGGLDGPTINKHEWFRAPVGLGPFKFKEWVSGSHIALTKNPDYFKEGQPYLDNIIYKIIPDANTLVNQLQTGDIDMRVRLSNEDVAVAKGLPNIEVITAPSVTPWLLWVNNTRAPFDDKRVRQALAHGFDKEGICTKLLKDLVEPAWGLVSSLSWAYNPDIPKFVYDPAKAKSLLDTAGWKPGADGIREKDGKKFSFEIMNIAGEQERVQILSLIQGQWKEIGVDAKIRMVDVGTMWGQALPKRDYEMAYSYTGRSTDPDMSSHYLSPELKPSANFAGYSNKEVDQLLTDAFQTVDENKRKELYFKAQQIVAEDSVYLFVYWLANHTALNKRVLGYEPAPGYVEFWNAGEWSIK